MDFLTCSDHLPIRHFIVSFILHLIMRLSLLLLFLSPDVAVKCRILPLNSGGPGSNIGPENV